MVMIAKPQFHNASDFFRFELLHCTCHENCFIGICPDLLTYFTYENLRLLLSVALSEGDENRFLDFKHRKHVTLSIFSQCFTRIFQPVYLELKMKLLEVEGLELL